MPLILVGMVDGARGIRSAWPAAVVGGLAFAVGQFVCSNYISVELTDIVASLLSAGAIVALLQVWQPSDPLQGETDGRTRPAIAGAAVADATTEREVQRKEGNGRDSRAEVFAAFAPYILIIVVFSIAQIGAGQDVPHGPRHRVRLAGAERPDPRRRGRRRRRPSSSAGPTRRARCCWSPAC